MKDKTQYKTKQRVAMIDYFRQLNGRHVTAADIQQSMYDMDYSIGMATIYRQLDKLVQDGLLRKYMLDGHAGACYQYIGGSDGCDEHYHLKCEGCGRLIHLDCRLVNEMQQHIREEHGFTVNNSKTVLYGICSQCQRNEG